MTLANIIDCFDAKAAPPPPWSCLPSYELWVGLVQALPIRSGGASGGGGSASGDGGVRGAEVVVAAGVLVMAEWRKW